MKKEKLQRKENRANNSENKLKRYALAGSSASRTKTSANDLSRGRYLNFRVVMKYDDGFSRLLFTDKKGARKLLGKFREMCLFKDIGAKRKCTDIVVNLKHRPNVVIERLSRAAVRAAYTPQPFA